MDSPKVPDIVEEEDLREKASNTLEALQDLVELIREDASHPDRIQTYSNHAERLLQALRNDLFSVRYVPQ
jgi:adenylate cyclase